MIMIINAKSVSLLAGVFQQSVLVLIIKYSETRNDGHVPYLTYEDVVKSLAAVATAASIALSYDYLSSLLFILGVCLVESVVKIYYYCPSYNGSTNMIISSKLLEAKRYCASDIAPRAAFAISSFRDFAFSAAAIYSTLSLNRTISSKLSRFSIFIRRKNNIFIINIFVLFLLTGLNFHLMYCIQKNSSIRSTWTRIGIDEKVQYKQSLCVIENSDHPQKGLNYTSIAGDTFWLPTDNDYLVKWGGLGVFFASKQSKVKYLRNVTNAQMRGWLGKCSSPLDVLAWLMNKVNENKSVLMIAYGELIHIHREKEFVKTNGKYIDDDIDMWASFDSIMLINDLEKDLFSLFGWTVRVFVNADKYVVFLQLMACCGHKPSTVPGKIVSSEPAIEIYPLPVVQENGLCFFKDLWQGTKFPEYMIYPQRNIDFNSSGTSQLLHLQIPHESFGIMECLYGDWRFPSKKHANTYPDCRNYTKLNLTYTGFKKNKMKVRKGPNLVVGDIQRHGSSCVTVNYDYPKKELKFISALDETFWLPTDNDYLVKWGGLGVFLPSKRSKVKYLRNVTNAQMRGSLGKCSSPLDVLAWLMNKVNENKSVLMIAYGELIHIHREKEFVNKTTGKYIDDDIDMWASFDSIMLINDLEKDLFSLFGWTVRVFVNADKYVVFLQLMACCGHKPSTVPGKIVSSEPAIEIYPLPVVQENGLCFFKDLWQGTKFPEYMIYPQRNIDFNSSGTSQLLHLQIPHESFGIMECLYGDWRFPSKKHANTYPDCRNYTKLNLTYTGFKKNKMKVRKGPNLVVGDIQRHGSSCVTVNYDYPKKELKFISALDETFWLPTDNDYLVKWGGLGVFLPSKRSKVKYLRNVTNAQMRGSLGKCSSPLDVLAWLMNKVNENKSVLMIAYGELIHIHREKEFVNKTTGKYIDDDIDMWASFDSIMLINDLEKDLFSLFGWTVRVFVNADKYVVFLQLMACCGHKPSTVPGKIVSSEPAIEIYPLPVVQENGLCFFKDLWQGTKFPEYMIYPQRNIDFNSSGTSQLLHLQMPHESFGIMECLYGDWRFPSKKHANTYPDCRNYKKLNLTYTGFTQI